MKAVTHKIAGVVFKTESNRELPLLGDDPFKLFMTDDDSFDVHNSVCKVDFDPTTALLPPEKGPEPFLNDSRISQDWLNNPFFKCPQVRERLNGLPDDAAAREIWIEEHYVYIYNFSCNRLDIFYTEEFGGFVTEQQKYMPEHCVASNFQQIFSSFLPNFSAILLHGAGVVRKGRAVLFFAPDEGGKTTVVKHSNGEPVLSDDQLIMRRKDGDIVAHATPLGTMTSGPCQARVGAVFLLEKAPAFGLKSIAPAEFVHCVWSMHQNNTFFLPRNLKKTAFQILCNLSYQVPVYLMHFPKNYVDWDAIDAAME